MVSFMGLGLLDPILRHPAEGDAQPGGVQSSGLDHRGAGGHPNVRMGGYVSKRVERLIEIHERLGLLCWHISARLAVPTQKRFPRGWCSLGAAVGLPGVVSPRQATPTPGPTCANGPSSETCDRLCRGRHGSFAYRRNLRCLEYPGGVGVKTHVAAEHDRGRVANSTQPGRRRDLHRGESRCPSSARRQFRVM